MVIEPGRRQTDPRRGVPRTRCRGSTVGFGTFTCYAGPGCQRLGILPESNILFGVHEFDFYDPILPRGYIQSWADVSRSTPDVPIYNSFCPAVTTAAQARRYGIEFVLEPDGCLGPAGRRLRSRGWAMRISTGSLVRPTPFSPRAAPGGQLPPADAPAPRSR